MKPGKKIRVLIVDDSAVVRQTLSSIIDSNSSMEVMGTASDPFVAARKMLDEVPDVITLDVEMPRMDGLTFLRRIMSQHPIPVVIISSLTAEGTETGLKALEYGAVEIITKPKMNTKEFIEESKIRICDAIKAASRAKLKRKTGFAVPSIKVEPKFSADAVIPSLKGSSMIQTTEKIIAMGASTGGTEALTVFLQSMPADSPGIVIVQHMPEEFTRSFANRLNDICAITVKEAANNDTVIRGRALIAPGNKHTLLKRSGARYYVEVIDGPLVNRHRPSVDVLFRSVAINAGANAVGGIMTGMGADGAKGLLEMKKAGAFTIAQDEASCVVFGMPHEAIKLDAHSKILPLDSIATAVLKVTR
ncbi:protein-glutamate methylesterase/protein-glutamine glutaminase [Alkalitalea saponilacus]|uniref:protein-glutamate methylesterase/protein-glutamine glutaminase n=1 Tax=Alkalitalea saponilacus TaxID=889453 RepID=UPI0009A5DD74|nr:chemotaxis response regulator protein-glutamate methylesterase [Alkalitalea saponilacus]ASB48336.1 chemotaxis response regulator protein-glutamate methylesterase [Alkalitalea saponilacus]